MKKIFTQFLLLSSVTLSAQDGKIDSTFGTNGRVSTSVFGSPVLIGPQKIVVLSTSKILQSFSIDGNFGIARYNSDDAATPDLAFGRFGTGVDTLDFGGADDVATSMIVQPDGKIVLAGYSNSVFALARYNADGTPDATFDGDGRVTTSFSTTAAAANALAIAPDGKLLLAGYSFNGGVNAVAVARYNTNGSLDATFDGDGRVTTTFNGANDQAFAVAVQPDGKVVIAGFTQTAGGSDFAVGRYNANGSLDATFDGDGKLSTGFGADAGAYAVALQSDGKIVAAGYGAGAINSDYALARYNANGTPDVSFDGDGKVTTAVGTGSDIIYSVVVQNDGRIVVGGTSFNTENDFSVARYTDVGAPDITFNGDGKNMIDFGGSEDYGYSFASQGLKLVVGGTAGTSLALTRLTNSTFILPVSLYTFSASKQPGAVLLNWQTLNEQSLAGFEVQRSSDGRSFETVGNASANGNTSSLRQYSVTDRKPLSGIAYYRLKMIDRDGKFAFSKTIIVRFDLDARTIRAFPNPVRTTVNLQFTAPAGKVRIQLSDAIGRAVHAMEVTSTGAPIYTSIDMSGYGKGIYFIHVNGSVLKVLKD